MRWVALILLGVALEPGCGTAHPIALFLPEPSSGESGLVAPVVDPSVMTFAFPFRGVKYRMTIEEGQGNVPGSVYASPDAPVDVATAKEPVMNACAFVDRFPDPATTGERSSKTFDWRFERACL